MKYKFEKPFASFSMSYDYKKKSLKEHWRVALHDPAYLLLWGGILALFIYCLIVKP
jgi:hypothetical protein